MPSAMKRKVPKAMKAMKRKVPKAMKKAMKRKVPKAMKAAAVRPTVAPTPTVTIEQRLSNIEALLVQQRRMLRAVLDCVDTSLTTGAYVDWPGFQPVAQPR